MSNVVVTVQLTCFFTVFIRLQNYFQAITNGWLDVSDADSIGLLSNFLGGNVCKCMQMSFFVFISLSLVE